MEMKRQAQDQKQPMQERKVPQFEQKAGAYSFGHNCAQCGHAQGCAIFALLKEREERMKLSDSRREENVEQAKEQNAKGHVKSLFEEKKAGGFEVHQVGCTCDECRGNKQNVERSILLNEFFASIQKEERASFETAVFAAAQETKKEDGISVKESQERLLLSSRERIENYLIWQRKREESWSAFSLERWKGEWQKTESKAWQEKVSEFQPATAEKIAEQQSTAAAKIELADYGQKQKISRKEGGLEMQPQHKNYIIGNYTYEEILAIGWLRQMYGHLIGISESKENGKEIKQKKEEERNRLKVENNKVKEESQKIWKEPKQEGKRQTKEEETKADAKSLPISQKEKVQQPQEENKKEKMSKLDRNEKANLEEDKQATKEKIGRQKKKEEPNLDEKGKLEEEKKKTEAKKKDKKAGPQSDEKKIKKKEAFDWMAKRMLPTVLRKRKLLALILGKKRRQSRPAKAVELATLLKRRKKK
ncbi:MAG: hypothetical protein N3G80_04635 [Candidatus Micrarchaeota archaeon]|nr:hypothetical protein [Candidatus Micrarchaeota archaeon]